MKNPFLNRQRFKIEEFLLVVVFMLVSVGSAYFGDYTAKKLEYEAASRGNYSENAISFVAYPGGNGDSMTQPLCDIINGSEGAALFMVGPANVLFYACGPQAYELPVKSGIQMTSEQSVGGEAMCMMGTFSYDDALSGGANGEQIVERNGAEYYVYPFLQALGLPTEYRILCVTGVSDSFNNANRYVYINMSTAKINVERAALFILDAQSEKSAAELYGRLEEFFAQRGCKVKSTPLPRGAFTVTDFFSMDRLNLIMRVFSVFCVVFATVPLTLFWSEKRRKAVAVRRLLGSGTTAQALRMLGRMMVLFHLGFAIGILLYTGVLSLSTASYSGLFSLRTLISYVAALAVNLLICAVPFVETIRIEPGDALRKE